MAQLVLHRPVSVHSLSLPFECLLQGRLSHRPLLPDIFAPWLLQPAALGKGVRAIECGFLEPRTAKAGGERFHIPELVTPGIKHCMKTMTGHGNIGQMPVHGGGGHDERPVDELPLAPCEWWWRNRDQRIGNLLVG